MLGGIAANLSARRTGDAMNDRDASPLAMAARHVMEGEERNCRQQAVVERMFKAGYQREATEARKVAGNDADHA